MNEGNAKDTFPGYDLNIHYSNSILPENFV